MKTCSRKAFMSEPMSATLIFKISFKEVDWSSAHVPTSRRQILMTGKNSISSSPSGYGTQSV